nr:flagella basal body P-ring formation protein FlgA [uncultured Brevundimonas sp.]
MTLIRSFLIASAVSALSAGAALAGPVTLKANPVNADGRVTLGDIFDGADAAANVVVAQRSGPSIVMEASQLQAIAARSGLTWDNPNGLRRVAIRRAEGSAATAAEVAAAPGAADVQPGFAPPARAAYRPSAAQQIIDRNDMVRVTYQVGGVSLSVMGKAMRNAAVGEPVAILNTASNRVIDAVAVGPGQAIAGPSADQVRANPQQLAAR